MCRTLDNGEAGVADRAAAAGDAGEGVADGRMAVAARSTIRDGIAAWRWRYPGVTLCPSDDLITAACLDYPRTGPVDGYFQVRA